MAISSSFIFVGACTYPGGSVIGINGRNAAIVVLKDLDKNLAAQVSSSISK